MKILITGHKGFIGRNFWRKLSAEGHELVGCDIKDGGMDCREMFRIDDPDRTVYDLIIHCAAIVGGRLKIEGEPLQVATDLSIDSEMFNWALRTGQKRVVYFSSSAAYPIQLQRYEDKRRLVESDIDLADIHNADNTYGWGKLTGEYLASFARQKGLEVYLFRPFSIYGADQDLDYPFPSFIRRVVNRRDPFEIWGYGEQVRDFIHIDDVMETIMRCVKIGFQGPLNLGSGNPISFVDLACAMFDVAGWRASSFDFKTDKPLGVDFRCGDITLLNTIRPPQISLREGIRRCLEAHGWAFNVEQAGQAA